MTAQQVEPGGHGGHLAAERLDIGASGVSPDAHEPGQSADDERENDGRRHRFCIELDVACAWQAPEHAKILPGHGHPQHAHEMDGAKRDEPSHHGTGTREQQALGEHGRGESAPVGTERRLDRKFAAP